MSDIVEHVCVSRPTLENRFKAILGRTIHGERSDAEEPFAYQTGQITITSDLAGSSQVTLVVDHRTGWLKSKKQKTLLNGSMQESLAGQTDTETTTEVMMEITTTVEIVESGK